MKALWKGNILHYSISILDKDFIMHTHTHEHTHTTAETHPTSPHEDLNRDEMWAIGIRICIYGQDMHMAIPLLPVSCMPHSATRAISAQYQPS